MPISSQARRDWQEITNGIERGDWDYINFFEHQVVPESEHWRYMSASDKEYARSEFWYQLGPIYASGRSRAAQEDLLMMLGIDDVVFWELWSSFYGAG